MVGLWNLWTSSPILEAVSHLLKIITQLVKAWTAIARLSVIWKSDRSNKIKCSFFQAAVMSILLYRCTTWTLTKHMERKLDGNCTRMLWAVSNKSWRQHPTKQQLYGHQDVAWKIYWVWWTIGTSDGRESGKSVLVAWHNI